MTTEWHERWQEGRTGFHESAPHPDLVAQSSTFLPANHRVLVPLCGKTVDMPWLAQKGHQVVGIELVPKAVEEFFAENKITPVVEDAGPFKKYSSENITIYCGDFFSCTTELLGDFDRVWDRASMVALPPAMRKDYVQKVKSLLRPGGEILLNVFDYDPGVGSGPPFSIPETEITESYSDCTVKLNFKENRIEDMPRFRERGYTYWNIRNYSIYKS